MLNLRTMNAEDLPVFKKWLRMPHVAKWYHEPLDWIEEVEKHVKTVMNYGEDTRKWADLTASII